MLRLGPERQCGDGVVRAVREPHAPLVLEGSQVPEVAVVRVLHGQPKEEGGAPWQRGSHERRLAELDPTARGRLDGLPATTHNSDDLSTSTTVATRKVGPYSLTTSNKGAERHGPEPRLSRRTLEANSEL